jgi:hypothetical protein
MQIKFKKQLAFSKGIFYVNGALKINSNFKRKIDNTILIYQRNGLNESLSIDGPTNVEVVVMVLYQFDVPLISYSYRISKPTENATWPNSTDDFYWDYDGWTPCSVSCGDGKLGIISFHLKITNILIIDC